jgi:hypothetical protein
MYNNNNNLTAQRQQHHQEPDIYALLSTDDPTTLDDSHGPFDTDALVMDIFDTNYSTLSNTNTANSSVTNNSTNTNNNMQSPSLQQLYNSNNINYDEHPLSTNTSNNNSINDNNSAFPTPNSTNFSSANTPNNNEFNFNNNQQGKVEKRKNRKKSLKKTSHNIKMKLIDLINFDITTTTGQSQQQYTPNNISSTNNSNYSNNNNNSNRIDSFFTPGFPQQQQEEDPLFPSFHPPPNSNNFDFIVNRRHSVAVSGGIADFNLHNMASQNNFQQQQQKQSRSRGSSPFGNSNFSSQTPPPQFQQQRQNQLLPQQRRLTTVIEGDNQPNMMHRASMPNIFLSEDSRRILNNSIQDRVSSLSARTTPASTPPPPVSINFNQMPWSTNNSDADWTHKKEPIYNEPIIGRKRFYSQQFDGFPTTTNQQLPPFRQLQQPSNLCPLPMSGVMSRRQSVATPNDIYTWNRMVNNPNDRIMLEEQQQRIKRRAQSIGGSNTFEEHTIALAVANTTPTGSNHHVKKRLVEDDTDSVTSNEDTSAEDYPVITEADLEAAKKDPNAIPRRQKLRYEGDEYTPKWVRYTGQSKEGYCDTCKPGKWLQLKNSAFWYHKQFYHGISSVSGKAFQRPLEQRAGEHDVIEGLCHQCKQFVPICNSKRKNSVLWYRHAHKVK